MELAEVSHAADESLREKTSGSYEDDDYLFPSMFDGDCSRRGGAGSTGRSTATVASSVTSTLTGLVDA